MIELHGKYNMEKILTDNVEAGAAEEANTQLRFVCAVQVC
jgi:hypothetical protein